MQKPNNDNGDPSLAPESGDGLWWSLLSWGQLKALVSGGRVPDALRADTDPGVLPESEADAFDALAVEAAPALVNDTAIEESFESPLEAVREWSLSDVPRQHQ